MLPYVIRRIPPECRSGQGLCPFVVPPAGGGQPERENSRSSRLAPPGTCVAQTEKVGRAISPPRRTGLPPENNPAKCAHNLFRARMPSLRMALLLSQNGPVAIAIECPSNLFDKPGGSLECRLWPDRGGDIRRVVITDIRRAVITARSTRPKCPVAVLTGSADDAGRSASAGCRPRPGSGRDLPGQADFVTQPKDPVLAERDVIITFRENYWPADLAKARAGLSRGDLGPATGPSPAA
jgi:hypothetical protein